ncbi:alpha-L-rhamnosidase C-terminal domain-containing protein [Burkholderia cepacia]|uniref:alpha-L-rhamnosidase-related protein n=1 Tax=Burkholderia cepacia TaxID=292 RepID=UPI0018C65B71|nr:alpha-L-rhamnosidase C-terminal domain-containing protein [Burkholderia cepacia]
MIGADSLVSGGNATLTFAAGQAPPQIVLDYGHEVGGLPYFDVVQQTGSPTLSAKFSEGKPSITTGDIGGSADVSADHLRVSFLRVSELGRMTNPLVQGGERYEVISLTTPGSVTLSQAGIQSLYKAPTAKELGSFVSSSPVLNAIWTAGAYTVEFNRLTAGAVPVTWTSTADGIVVGAGAGSVQKVSSWSSDYTMTFDMRVDRNSGAWMMRNGFNLNASAFQFILHSAQDTFGAPDTLEFGAGPVGAQKTLATLPLPISIAPGSWHNIRASLAGNAITIFVDSVQIGSLDARALGASALLTVPTGGAGFFNVEGSQATYRNLSIGGPDGSILYSSPLNSASAIDDFDAGTNTLPVLMDGGKRDRAVWVGDLLVSGPALYYSSYQTDAIAGSIRLLGSYVRSNGEVSSTHSPQAPLVNGVADSYSSTSFYSAQYSLHFISDLYDYYLHTGDVRLVAEQWPTVKGELAYIRSLIDANGLVSVNAADAQDWSPSVTPVTGEVTSTNLIYYRSLIQAAELARVADGSASTADYLAQADTLKKAINARLYNETSGFYSMSATTQSTLVQDTNSLAILTGVASATNVASILGNMSSSLASPFGRLAFGSGSGRGTPVISPFTSDLEVRARFESGDTQGALDLIQTLWGRMLSMPDYYTGAMWEVMSTTGNPSSAETSLAHGWSSGPTGSLSKYVLGVRPVSAGFRQWLIKPQPGNLKWVVGRVPTPYGSIGVKWGVGEQGAFSMEVTVPPGTSGAIAVPPTNSSAPVLLNGKVVTTSMGSPLDSSTTEAVNATPYRYINGIGPGTYLISVGGA